MRDVVTDAGERVDHRLHLIEHAIHDRSESGERIVYFSIGETLTKVAGDDALNPLIDLLDAPLRAHAQPDARQQAKAERRQQPQCEGLAHDGRNLAGLVDIASKQEDIAIVQMPADSPDQRIATRRLANSRSLRSLRPAIDPEAVRHLPEIARKPIAGRIEQSRILHATGVLAKMVRNRISAPIARQGGHEIELLGDHPIGTRDQITVDLPVDKAEYRDHEDGEDDGHSRSPPEGI
nr:hypothetical protein [Bradyrhizobium sp. WSM3983]